ncbi:MAG: glycosyltransferase family 2 protein [Chloroflexi bacterium]|nr:MAG: glycosyltransferase family 2 protein [Chloroflexota bacterium]
MIPLSPPAPRLAAVILTKNEDAHIGDCIAGLRDWVDLVVVWDSGSTDATCARARAAGAAVVQRPFDTYAAQRQAVLDTLTVEWVLFVDADERAGPELAAEIRRRLAEDTAIDGYWIPRRNWIAGRETRWGGFYPDYQLRLLRRAAARYARGVHEIASVTGETAYLQTPLLHYNYRDWAHFHAKQPGYARLEAGLLAARGIRPRPHNFVLQPLREFRRRYFTLQGRRDGLHGLRLALWLAWYYGFMPYWYLLRGG